jgi:hypothetical protein
MLDWFDRKRVAVVGNASSLFNSVFGKEIDNHEVVVRINRSSTICFPENDNEKSQGTRTDVWAFSFADSMETELTSHHKICDKLIQMNDAKLNKKTFDFTFECMKNEDIDVLTKSLNDMKKVIDKEFVRQEMIKFNYDEKFRHIKKHRAHLLQDLIKQDIIKSVDAQLNTNKKFVPSTGLRLLHYISLGSPESVNIYGFDWKETPTFYDKKKETRVTEKKHNHNFFLEKEYCKKVFHDKHGFRFCS